MRMIASLALAAVLFSSATADAARIFIIHGIPGVPVDVYANLGRPASAVRAEDSQLPAEAGGPATIDIRIYARGANPQSASPVIQVLGAKVPGPGEISILAHLDRHGVPTATIYTNDSSRPVPGAARVSVCHAAAAPAGQLVAGGVRSSP